MHHNVNAKFEGGREKKRKGFARIPFFSRTGNVLLDERGQECLITLMRAYHEDKSSHRHLQQEDLTSTEFYRNGPRQFRLPSSLVCRISETARPLGTKVKRISIVWKLTLFFISTWKQTTAQIHVNKITEQSMSYTCYTLL